MVFHFSSLNGRAFWAWDGLDSFYYLFFIFIFLKLRSCADKKQRYGVGEYELTHEPYFRAQLYDPSRDPCSARPVESTASDQDNLP